MQSDNAKMKRHRENCGVMDLASIKCSVACDHVDIAQYNLYLCK